MKIIEKKKASKKYYYLRHNIRKKGKIITKEKYLGQEIPKNIESLKEAFRLELKSDLNKKLKAIKRSFQNEWNKLPPTVKKKELEEISIAFTYNTNAIEGSTITLEEVREIVQDKLAPNKPLRDIKEAEAHNKVFLQMINKKEKITKDLILKWHKEIFSDTKPDISGKFRDYLVRIGSYLAPDWQEVEKLIQELIEFIQKDQNMNPVEFAARVHYRFEKIHPFGDGNGRIGRLLMNYILWYKKYPLLIIEYKKRKSYYKALQKDEEGFVSYFLRRYLAVHKIRLSEKEEAI